MRLRRKVRGSVTLLGAISLCCWLPLLAPAQTAKRPGVLSRGKQLRTAEELYKAGKLLEAEPLYRKSLASTTTSERRLSYTRLLSIYVRVGRPDEAIRLGLRYRTWLKEIGDRNALPALTLQLGACYMLLGHYPVAERLLQGALKAFPEDAPLMYRLTTRVYLARTIERQGAPERAAPLWKQVEELALARIEDKRQPLEPRQRIECVRELAESYHHQYLATQLSQKQGDKRLLLQAVAQLKQLLPVHDRLKDFTGKRDTLGLLAKYHMTLRNHSEAETYLKQALEVHQKHREEDRLTSANLTARLVETLERQGEIKEANKKRLEAVQHYQAVLKDPRASRPDSAGAVTAFWELRKLYLNSAQYSKALQLTSLQAKRWGDSVLIQSKLKHEQGSFQYLLGGYARARPFLRESVAVLEKQQIPNLVELPLALNNLAVVELATDNPNGAEKLGKRCLEIYKKHNLPDDPTLVEVYNLLGGCSALRGNYAQAIEHYREGVSRCKKLDEVADQQHSNLLLNIAMLHKAQNDLPAALRTCKEALVIFKRFAPPEALGFACFDAARVNMLVTQGKVGEAYALTDEVLRLCRKHKVDRGPLIVTALHCQSLHALMKRDIQTAQKGWQRVLALQQQDERALLMPRTLNYLGLCGELKDDLPDAEKCYRQARKLQQKNPRAFPVTHFITLWRLANLAIRRGGSSQERARARDLLEQGIAVVEKARLQTYGDAKQRASYFAQFAPAFDQLVDWSIEDDLVRSAFSATLRGRSRTLRDQLEMTGVDPRMGLKGERGKRLIQQEEKIRQQLASLRARAQFFALEAASTEQGKKLLAEFDRAQQEYANVRREILNASPVYRNLSAQNIEKKALTALDAPGSRLKKLLLVYHLGRERSYLLLLGSGGKVREAFPLTVPTVVAARLTAPKRTKHLVPWGQNRGVVLRARSPLPPAPRTTPNTGEQTPLSKLAARHLVDHYLNAILYAQWRPGRGIRLTPRKKDQPIPVQPLELPARVFLPPAVRTRIRELAPDCLVVVPDGPLHKLPLESLLVKSGKSPRYAVDELPPIVYVPTAALLAMLAERPSPRRSGPPSVLTVANPSYPQENKPSSGASPANTSRSFLGLPGQLTLLPFTAHEARHLRGLFGTDHVWSLEGPKATEKAVVNRMAGKHIVHIAAHGFTSSRFGNLFGGLALTPAPPAKLTLGNDGFLSLHEIYQLPLQNCELAVLSACLTNVGPQPPLEAGVTLASGFLAAGSRRVVASQWSVDDPSTAALMSAFFSEIHPAMTRGKVVPYAQALQQARLKVRAKKEWASPFYWAPFVLIGWPE